MSDVPKSDFEYFLIGIGCIAVILVGIALIPAAIGLAGLYVLFRKILF